MGLRTNPDRILENIDRQRIREEEAQAGQDRQATGRELETEIPDVDATTPERMKRILATRKRPRMPNSANWLRTFAPWATFPRIMPAATCRFRSST